MKIDFSFSYFTQFYKFFRFYVYFINAPFLRFLYTMVVSIIDESWMLVVLMLYDPFTSFSSIFHLTLLYGMPISSSPLQFGFFLEFPAIYEMLNHTLSLSSSSSSSSLFIFSVPFPSMSCISIFRFMKALIKCSHFTDLNNRSKLTAFLITLLWWFKFSHGSYKNLVPDPFISVMNNCQK